MQNSDNDFVIPKGSQRPTSLRPWYKHWWGQLLIVFATVALAVAVAFGLYVAKLASLVQDGNLSPEAMFANQPSATRLALSKALATADDPSYGPQNAKVVIVEFADFQCPFCAELYPVIKQVMQDYGDQVLFIYRDFPLTSEHPQALIGAMAGQCAHEQGKFWEMHNKIFDNQGDISEAALKSYAVQIGANSLQFNDCMSSNKYLDEIQKDLQDGYAAGVRATPTLFINGGMIPGAIPYATLEKIITNELVQQ